MVILSQIFNVPIFLIFYSKNWGKIRNKNWILLIFPTLLNLQKNNSKSHSGDEAGSAKFTNPSSESCPAGTKRKTDKTACESCPDSHISSEGSSSCTPCNEGEEANTQKTLCRKSYAILLPNCIHKFLSSSQLGLKNYQIWRSFVTLYFVVARLDECYK